MRLSVLMLDPRAIARPLAPIAAIVLFLAGCTITGGLSGQSSSFGSYSRDPSTLYLRDMTPVTPQREYLDRYACATGKPLMCQCTTRIGGTCDCHC